MGCFGFCGEKCSKKKKKAKEKYKEEVDKETNGMTVPLQNETQFPEAAGGGQEMGTISETLSQVSQETGDLSPHVAPSGVGNPASLDNNVKQDEKPNKSSVGQNDAKQTSQVTHEVKKNKPDKPKQRYYHDNQECSDSEADSSSDSSSDESPSTDDSDDSPVERTQSSKTEKKSRSIIINAPGGIVDFGKHNTNKIVHIPYGGQKKKKKNKDKDGSSRSHKKESRTTAAPHQDPKCSTESGISNEHTNAIPRWPLQHDHQPQPGNLKAQFDRTDAVYKQRLIANLASSIGIIRSPSTCGTGFRVGPNYVMTAKHVTDGILKPVPVQIAQQRQPIINYLNGASVYIDFSYEIPNQPVDENSKFFFEPEIVYENEDLDVAILKLRPSANAYPPPLINFSELIEMDGNLYFIGHSRANIKEMDKFSCVKLTPYQISALHNWRFKNVQPGGFNGVENRHRQLLHCTFEKGASGAPGVWITPADHMPYVVLMLLRGFPDWYYDEKAPQELKFAIPKNYCVEQGVCMLEIYKAMKQKNPSLCQEIFHYNSAVLSAPTCEDVEMKSLENC